MSQNTKIQKHETENTNWKLKLKMQSGKCVVFDFAEKTQSFIHIIPH